MRFVVAPMILAALLLAAPPTPAHAQAESREGIALQNEIYQLRQELKSVEDKIANGGGAGNRAPAYAPSYGAPTQLSGSSDLLTQLLSRVDTLEDQVRELRGHVDEMQNQMQTQNADLGKRIDDLAFQINPQAARSAAPPGGLPSAQDQPPPTVLTPPTGTLTPPAGMSPGMSSGPVTPPPAPRPPVPRTPEMAMQEGNAALARRDYTAAEDAARAVLANRVSPRAYDARLLLAQALSGEKQYAQSAIAFDDAYKSSPKGTHAQDALLGLASSLNAINEKKAACDTLSRLRADFPQPRGEIASGASALAQKAGCR